MRETPSARLLELLGRAQMKAKLWKEAVENFNKALDQLVRGLLKCGIVLFSDNGTTNNFSLPLSTFLFQKPPEGDKWPPEAAQLHFLRGLCCLETKETSTAHEAFNRAIALDPKHASVRISFPSPSLQLIQVFKGKVL